MPPRLDIKFDCSQFFRIETIEPTARRVVPSIKNVIFNYPATIVFWDDGTKTVVKCGKRDPYSREAGLALCIAKKALGNKGNWYNEFKKHIKDDEDFVDVDEFVARIDAIREDIESAQKEKYVERLYNILETIKFNKKTVLQLPVILNADVLDALEWLLTETLKEDKSQK